MAASYTYLIALGSNRRHAHYGRPRDVLDAALVALTKEGVHVLRTGPVLQTDPIGPSLRRYANSAAVIRTDLAPDDLLTMLKSLERRFGRRSGGQRWTARVLDLDIILWDGGTYASRDLTIPHPLFRERDFVLRPAAPIAGQWKDPVTGFSLRQLTARLTAKRPLPR